MASHGENPHYQHTRLSDASKQIRLLKTAPPLDDDDTLSFELETFNIDDVPSYRTLSYTWGDEANPDHILLNGKVSSVRRNLLDFLQEYKHRNTDGYIWIDALCIDQSDAHERSVQVAMMGDVFQQGSELIIWLGLDPTPNECLSRWMKEVIKDIEKYPREEHSPIRLRADLNWMYNFGNRRLPPDLILGGEHPKPHPKTTPRMWRTKYLPDETMDATISRDLDLLHSQFLPKVSQHAYFARIWIVQECAKSSQRQIWFQHSQIRWESLRHLVEYLKILLTWTTGELEHGPMARLLRLTHDPYEDTDGPDEYNGYHPPPENLWMRFCQNKCSDPRDVIFALQTLVEPSYRCAPDYTKPTEVVFIDAVTAWLTPIKTRQRFLDFVHLPRWLDTVALRMRLRARRVLLDEQSPALTNVLNSVFQRRIRYLRMKPTLRYWQPLLLRDQIEKVQSIVRAETKVASFDEVERADLLRELFQVVLLGKAPDRFAEYIGDTAAITDTDYSVIFELVKEKNRELKWRNPRFKFPGGAD